jgi:hypothetical protein
VPFSDISTEPWNPFFKNPAGDLCMNAIFYYNTKLSERREGKKRSIVKRKLSKDAKNLICFVA